jgi:hypothetical protein
MPDFPGKGTARRIAALLVWLALLSPVAARVAQGAELSLAAEPELSVAIDKLNARGRFPGFAAGTRPYALRAVRAAVDNALAGRVGDPFDEELLRWVAWYAAPKGDLRVDGALSLAERRTVPPDAEGVPRPNGASLAAGAGFRVEPAPWFSAQGAGAAFLADEGDRGTRLLDTSAEIGGRYLSLQAGKISSWYGPGRNGSLILSNNAQPVPGVRLRNPEPIPMPGLLSFLGTLRYDLFVARLEGDRPVPHTYFSGMRLSIRPGPRLELGASRVMHYGGQGRPSGFSAWWTAFKGTKENEPGSDGNQIGGFDMTVTLPFEAQPVQLYAEAAGEDEAKIIGTPIPGPTKWAYLGGVFLPALLGSSRADLRFEWAQNHLKDNGPAWYVHAASDGGYAHRYRGRILGHPMGTDARQLDLTGHWFFLPSTFLELSLGTLRRYSPGGPEAESTTRAGAAFVGWLTENLRAEGRFGVERVKRRDGFPDSSGNDLSLLAMLTWREAVR